MLKILIERAEDGYKHIEEVTKRALEPLKREADQLAKEAALIDEMPPRAEIPGLLRKVAARARNAAGRIRGLLPEAEQKASEASFNARADLDIPDREIRHRVSLRVTTTPIAHARVLDDRAMELEGFAMNQDNAASAIQRALTASAAARAVVVDRDRELAGVVQRALDGLRLPDGAAA